MAESWLDIVKWDEHGLVPAIAQEFATNDVLTLAWRLNGDGHLHQKGEDEEPGCPDAEGHHEL